MSSDDIDFSDLLKPVGNFSLDALVNQFLWDNGVDDENFDNAKEEIAQLIKIARLNPDEEIKTN